MISSNGLGQRDDGACSGGDERAGEVHDGHAGGQPAYDGALDQRRDPRTLPRRERPPLTQRGARSVVQVGVLASVPGLR